MRPLQDRDSKPSVQSVLQSSTLLNALTARELEVVAQSSRVVQASKGEVIWLGGSDVDFFGLAANGFIKMVRGSSDGTDVTVELMGPGQIFGLMGTISLAGCPLNAVAVTDLWYARISKQPFLTIYQGSTALKDRLIRRMTLRLHGAMDLMAKMSSGRVDERIAAILFILGESYGEREGDELILRVPLTRQDIAEMAGTTVESTIRTMSRWQKEGLVTTEKQLIRILDESALAKVITK